MAMTVIGVQAVHGDYEGHEYHNLRLHCTCPLDVSKPDTYGEGVEYVSVKLDKCAELLGGVSGQLSGLVGEQVEVLYNKWGKVDRVVLV